MSTASNVSAKFRALIERTDALEKATRSLAFSTSVVLSPKERNVVIREKMKRKEPLKLIKVKGHNRRYYGRWSTTVSNYRAWSDIEWRLRALMNQEDMVGPNKAHAKRVHALLGVFIAREAPVAAVQQDLAARRKKKTKQH